MKNKQLKKCERCGVEYKPHRDSQKYCSRKCYISLNGSVRQCAICNKNYEPKYKEQKCCSKECAIKSLSNVVANGVCVICGKQFDIKRSARQVWCCSMPCAQKRYKIFHTDKHREDESCRRARKRGSRNEKVDFTYICERDSWKCQICGKKVDKLKKFPEPLSPSMDHIMPISLGGSHSKDNIQLVHLRCNLCKSASTGYQMRLIG